MSSGTTLQAGDVVYYLDEVKSCAHIGVIREIDQTSGAEAMVQWMCFGRKSPFVGVPAPCADLKLLNRSFDVGEIVRRVSDRNLGSVIKVSTKANAQLVGHNRAIFDVDCDQCLDISPWASYSNARYVFCEGWYGRISEWSVLCIVTFSDGARLLVSDQTLEYFQPVGTPSSPYASNCFEGAVLHGDVLDLRSNIHHTRSSKCNFFGPAKKHSFMKNDSTANHNEDGSSENLPSVNDCREQHFNKVFDTHDFEGDYPPIHPIPLLNDLTRHPVTKAFVTHPEQLDCLLERTPIFLTETPAHNALRLSRLQYSVDVTIFVERIAPVMAKVHWIASCGDDSGEAPPSVVYGADLLKLKPLAPIPISHFSVADVVYYQLKDTDILHNLEFYKWPEQLLYAWFCRKNDLLDSSKISLSALTTAFTLNEVNDTEVCVKFGRNACRNKIQPEQNIKEGDDKSLLSSPSRLTPFWAQVNLFETVRRRSRVIVNPRHRVTYTSFKDWYRKAHDYDTSSSDNDDYLENDHMSTGDGDDSIKPEELNDQKENQQGSCIGDEAENDPTNVVSPKEFGDQSINDGTQYSPITTKRRKEKHALSKVPALKLCSICKLSRQIRGPIKSGCWVPFEIFSVESVYTVRWQDGTVQTGVTSDQLEAFSYIADTEVFPGYLVSLKYAKNHISIPEPVASADSSADAVDLNTKSSHDLGIKPLLDDFTRDFGIVLSCNPNDRMYIVQWFTVGDCKDGVGPLIRVGQPEETSLYDLGISNHNQVNYGDLIRAKVLSDTSHSYQVGYVEDLRPDVGKLVIRWADGTLGEVYRSEYLETFSSDDESSDDLPDSDETDSDSSYLKSDLDDETLLLTKDASNDKTQQDQNNNVSSEAGVTVATTERLSVIREVANNLLLVNDNISTACQVLNDRYTFVLWLMRCLVQLPGVGDELIEQVYVAMRLALMLNSSLEEEQESVSSVECESNPPTESLTSTSKSTEFELPPFDVMHFCTGVPTLWDNIAEADSLSCAEMLNFSRILLLKAYQAHHDFRVKRMCRLCDFRSSTFGRYIIAVLRLVESNVSINYSDQTSQIGVMPYGEDFYTLHLKRLNINFKHLKQCPKNDATKYNVTTVTRKRMVPLINDRLKKMQKYVLGNLTELCDELQAWCGESAPEILRKISKSVVNEKLSEDLTQSTTQCQIDNAQTLDVSTTDNSLCLKTESSTPEEGEITSSMSEVKCVDEVTELEDANVISTDCLVNPTIDEFEFESLPVHQKGLFVVEPSAPTSHIFYSLEYNALSKEFIRAWRRDNRLLSTSIPSGIVMKAFGDRMDLYSLMIVGSPDTPYQDCLFFFDIGLLSNYPDIPPRVHYYSFSSQQVNPNLYSNGHICLSLLGTWDGNETEKWNADTSSLLQLAVSLQALILNAEPYFNEAGYAEKRVIASCMAESRAYNETVVVRTLESMISILQNPIPLFRDEIIHHCVTRSKAYVSLLKYWSTLTNEQYERLSNELATETNQSNTISRHPLPGFPLPPVSKGFQLFISRHCALFMDLVSSLNKSDLEKPNECDVDTS